MRKCKLTRSKRLRLETTSDPYGQFHSVDATQDFVRYVDYTFNVEVTYVSTPSPMRRSNVGLHFLDKGRLSLWARAITLLALVSDLPLVESGSYLSSLVQVDLTTRFSYLNYELYLTNDKDSRAYIVFIVESAS